jgi:hypothetical protein
MSPVFDCVPNHNETVCSVCGWKKPERIIGWPRRNCPKSPNSQLHIKGPGDFLHDAILKWVGEAPTRECSCKDRIAKMNAWGPQSCREHLDEIIEWMMGEAKQRGWWKVAVAVPGSRLFIKRMVMSAIKQAEITAAENPVLQ